MPLVLGAAENAALFRLNVVQQQVWCKIFVVKLYTLPQLKPQFKTKAKQLIVVQTNPSCLLVRRLKFFIAYL